MWCSDYQYCNSAGKGNLEENIIEDSNGSMTDVHVHNIKKPKPSAVRDFPPGCGRYASPITTFPSDANLASQEVIPSSNNNHVLAGALPSFNGSHKSLSCRTTSPKSYMSAPKCSAQRLSASRDFPFGCGRNAPVITKEEFFKAAAASHKRENPKSIERKDNDKSGTNHNVKSGINHGINFVKQEECDKKMKYNLLRFRQASKESLYNAHCSQREYKNFQSCKVRTKTRDINQLSNTRKEDNREHHNNLDQKPKVERFRLRMLSANGTNQRALFKHAPWRQKLAVTNSASKPISSSRFGSKATKRLIKKEAKWGNSEVLTHPSMVKRYNSLTTSRNETNGGGSSNKVEAMSRMLSLKTTKRYSSKSVAATVPMVYEPSTRAEVRETLRLFQVLCRKILQNEESRVKDPAQAGTRCRVDLMASKILREKNLYVNMGKQIVGTIPGVEVGDQFHYRIELCIVGLHRQIQAGIDFLRERKEPVATSIVASGGYEDDVDNGDVLIYTGHGGNNYNGDRRQSTHQKLERGNLALKNSIDLKIPVRVIRGIKQKHAEHKESGKNKGSTIYTYDGLYNVETYWLDIGASGYTVFKFLLRRQPGQPELGFKIVHFAGKPTIQKGIRIKDISEGKERKAICVVNNRDEENGPEPFVYTTRVLYPGWCKPMPHRGCECTDGCSDRTKCFCALKNGGQFPYNYDGAIVFAKPIVYECGPSCSCPPNCHNKVSQHGIRFHLEVFKTDKRGWGVRSLDSIPSGSFICEYTGELLSDAEAEQRIVNDEYLFDIGRNSKDQSLWPDISHLVPEIGCNSECDMVEDLGFTIDAAKYGNVGRFVNHSCSPNVYAQNVLYDHDDKRIPHIMLFAAENIPPMRELFYHYNYSVDQVYDCHGNIKKKFCYCGSPECTGRMY